MKMTTSIIPSTNGNYAKVYTESVDSSNNSLSDGNNILQSYAASDIQSGTTSYFGFLRSDGAWYIVQKTSTAIRYIKGASDYTTNWTGRAALSYGHFNAVF